MRASKPYSLQMMISQNVIGHWIAKHYSRLQCTKRILEDYWISWKSEKQCGQMVYQVGC
ncbi:hypothetical protein E2C01_095522 [Portunus trituberculatus]|uniref:Uncharacterized protein n=1 Tax=Portunus trituberculatus TaxID=210409 RepID=A0A5B7K0D3_PORTR|nr:hypothetical protein [Portunus trituberculatus]